MKAMYLFLHIWDIANAKRSKLLIYNYYNIYFLQYLLQQCQYFIQYAFWSWSRKYFQDEPDES